jgi:hypothetical protein
MVVYKPKNTLKDVIGLGGEALGLISGTDYFKKNAGDLANKGLELAFGTSPLLKGSLVSRPEPVKYVTQNSLT